MNYKQDTNGQKPEAFSAKNLKFLAINTCGLRSKLNYPEFVELIHSYDIIGVQETKLDDLDSLQLPGYEIICQNRKKLSRYRSGGTALIVKSSIFPFIKTHESKSKLIQWFSISNRLTRLNTDILCGIVYIPPYGSKYSHEDPYLEIHTEYSSFCSDIENVILFGDFNSRTACLDDFVIVDDFISRQQNDDTLYSESMQVLDCLLKCNLPINRRSADPVTNAYGKQLIEFCQSNDLFIINGRLGQDFIDPKLTCKDRSTIDYFICSPKFIEYLCDFNVLDFSPFFSDSHCGVDLMINIKCKTDNQNLNQNNLCEESKPQLWNSEKANIFPENCNINKIRSINEKLESMRNGNILKSDVDSVATDIENVFQEACIETFGIHKSRPHSVKKIHKPWFNYECRNARNSYHNARKIYNRNKSEQNKTLLKTVSKAYKNTMSINIKRHKNEKIEKLRRIKSSNPKEFWRILNDENCNQASTAPLNDLYNFFKNLNSKTTYTQTNNLNEEIPNQVNEEINQPITENEILQAVKSLKMNKAAGIDQILNEHIKSSINIMLPTYTKLFNIVFDTGLLPDSWLLGNILPIYKNKGDIRNPENYRPITLLSCLGKLFTAVINNRLNKFSRERHLINDSQAGFRTGFSTADNIFIINSLIDILRSRSKKLFCAFIDFKQAFDTVWREGLWYKLETYNINGKCLKLIRNMYDNIKSRIKNKDGTSPFFPCCNGVRQGENLSPFLFSIFLNDLEHYFSTHNISGINCEYADEDIYVFVKMFILLYADDTVIFSEDSINLQNALNAFENYCHTWKLVVNVPKTKILIFSKGRPNNQLRFYFDDCEIEIVNEYKYLGILLSRSGAFNKTKKYLAEQANKALFSLLRKTRNLDLTIDLQIELFNKTVKPILLYGCEIWGYGNCDDLERIQLKFLKYTLNLKKSTPTYMIYGELGIKPISLDIKARVISFWSKLVTNQDNKLSSIIYTVIHRMHKGNTIKSNYMKNVENILNACGFPGIWESQYIQSLKWFNLAISQRLQDQYIQTWSSLVDSSSSGINFRLFKDSFECSRYFSLLPNYYSKILIAFRTRNHRLPIEIGRWNSTPVHERVCHFCHNDIGDEFHYILSCEHFKTERLNHIKVYYRKYPNVIKFKQLMNSSNVSELKHLCKFIKVITKAMAAV